MDTGGSSMQAEIVFQQIIEKQIERYQNPNGAWKKMILFSKLVKSNVRFSTKNRYFALRSSSGWTHISTAILKNVNSSEIVSLQKTSLSLTNKEYWFHFVNPTAADSVFFNERLMKWKPNQITFINWLLRFQKDRRQL